MRWLIQNYCLDIIILLRRSKKGLVASTLLEVGRSVRLILAVTRDDSIRIRVGIGFGNAISRTCVVSSHSDLVKFAVTQPLKSDRTNRASRRLYFILPRRNLACQLRLVSTAQSDDRVKDRLPLLIPELVGQHSSSLKRNVYTSLCIMCYCVSYPSSYSPYNLILR